VYGNRNRGSIIFFEELEAIKNRYLDRFNFINILSRERMDTGIHFGRIDKDKLLDLEGLIDYSKMHEVFICGPEEMIFTVKGFLEGRGLDSRRIHFELFTTPGQKKTARTGSVEQEEKGPSSNITVRLDGRTFSFDLSMAGNISILDAALRQGADLPYACKGGVCCTCKAKLVEGNVKMDVHWGLEQEEIEEGYILTCQSHPVTEKVVVDFDVR
jgi:ring-1,2-phenylacetyl-CoA epoxidase subunit PaaE